MKHFSKLITLFAFFVAFASQNSFGMLRAAKQFLGISTVVTACKTTELDRARSKDIVTQGEDKEASERIERLKIKFAQKKRLGALHPVLQEEFDKAVLACNITKPIIALQDDNDSESYMDILRDEQFYEVPAVVIGVADNEPLPLIRNTIYHELGHLVAGDKDSAKVLTRSMPGALINMGTGVYAGRKVFGALRSLPKMIRIPAAIVGGVATSFAFAKIYSKTIHPYQIRKLERNADIFAAQKLLAQGDFCTPLYNFLNLVFLMDEGKSNKNGEFWLFHDHPSYRERAMIVLDEFKKHNVDFANIPLDKEKYPDADMRQQQFTERVNKYFPQYVKKT